MKIDIRVEKGGQYVIKGLPDGHDIYVKELIGDEGFFISIFEAEVEKRPVGKNLNESDTDET